MIESRSRIETTRKIWKPEGKEQPLDKTESQSSPTGATGQPVAGLIRDRTPVTVVATSDEVPTMKDHENHQFVEQLFQQQILRLTKAANSFDVQHSDAWL